MTETHFRQFTWEEPQSLAEASARREALVGEVQAIQAQLGDHGLTRNSEYRTDLATFEDWRRRAKWALKHRVEELRLTNAWIKAANIRTSEEVKEDLVDLSIPEIMHEINDLLRELIRRIPKDG
jgi:hypothetical protein